MGECPNSFVLDVKVTDDNYTLYKTTITENMHYHCDKGAFQLYDEDVSNNEYGMTYVMIGFYDEQKIIRCIYMVSNGGEFSFPGSQLLGKYTSSKLW